MADTNDGTTVISADGTRTVYDSAGHPVTTTTADGREIVWAVDLPALKDAITAVGKEKIAIRESLDGIRSLFKTIETEWQSPASVSFVSLSTAFNSAAASLLDVLDEATSRMNTAYNNYLDNELTNVRNTS